MMNTNKTTGKTELGDLIQHNCRKCGDDHTYKANIVTPAYSYTAKQVTGTRVDYEGDCEANSLSFWDHVPSALIETSSYDLVDHLYRQRAFSQKTFGPGLSTKAILAHIRKELIEVEKAPKDVTEWIDVVLLAFDGAWRSGHSPEAIAKALEAKQTKNEGRKWPDWRTAFKDAPIEHDR